MKDFFLGASIVQWYKLLVLVAWKFCALLNIFKHLDQHPVWGACNNIYHIQNAIYFRILTKEYELEWQYRVKHLLNAITWASSCDLWPT
jgi:hypothetical protein